MTNVALMPQRPPYVEFERRSEEDRIESAKRGCKVFVDVDYAIIRALGSKDSVEKKVSDWLPDIRLKSQADQYPREWVRFFEELYTAWQNGNDSPVNGTHVKNWAAISPAERDTLIASKIYTVEDVAEANEETLMRIGMGARALKHRARAWIDSASKGGEELNVLRAENKNLRDKVTDLNEKVQALSDVVQRLEGEQQAKTPAKSRS